MTLTLQSSYAIIHQLDRRTGRELTGIRCLNCERTSWNDGDVQNLYCANCHIFHADNVPFETIVDGKQWPIRIPIIYKKPGLLERLWRWAMRSKE